jgi:hypothetical protein
MPTFKLLGAATALFVAGVPAMAQQVISEPGYCAQFYPNANCQNKGPGNPYTAPKYPRDISQGAPMWNGDRSVGVAGKRMRTHHSDSSVIRKR